MPSHDRLRIALFTYSTQPRGGVLHALALAEALHDMGHRVVLHALDDSGRGFIRTPRCACVLFAVEPSRAAILPFVQRRVAAFGRGLACRGEEVLDGGEPISWPMVHRRRSGDPWHVEIPGAPSRCCA